MDAKVTSTLRFSIYTQNGPGSLHVGHLRQSSIRILRKTHTKWIELKDVKIKSLSMDQIPNYYKTVIFVFKLRDCVILITLMMLLCSDEALEIKFLSVFTKFAFLCVFLKLSARV